MLAVIADDFTGASEIAGLALLRGFRVAIETRSVTNLDTDILVLATDMRSLSPSQAAKKSALLTGQLLALNPEMIFKKVDSVFRGNIGPELQAQMAAEKKSQALLITANPSLNRTVIDGVCYVNGTPLSESGFAESRSLEVETSNVTEILENQGVSRANSISPQQAIEGVGIFVGDAEHAEDLAAWAGKVNTQIVTAGAADFFDAILAGRQVAGSSERSTTSIQESSKALYICGSKFPSSRRAVAAAKDLGYCVIDMPDEIYFGESLSSATIDGWAQTVTNAFSSHQQVILAVTQKPNGAGIDGGEIARIIGTLTRRILEDNSVDELMIEGGATAQAVIRALDIDVLYPAQSLAPGVTRMKVYHSGNLHVTMKPGSYRWPASIWTFNE